MAVATPASTTHLSCPRITIILAAILLLSLVWPANGHPTERSRDSLTGIGSEAFSDISDISVSYFKRSNESSDNSSSYVADATTVHILEEEERRRSSNRDSNNSSTNTILNNDLITGCPKCRSSKSETKSVLAPSEEEQDTVRMLRLEMVKAQILSKLGLEAPPVVDRTRPLPDAVTSDLVLLDAPEPSPPQERESTKILVAKNRVACPPSSPRHAVCFTFPSSSHLWDQNARAPSSPSSGGVPSTALHFWLSAHQGGHHKRSPHVTVTRLFGYGHHRHQHHHLPATSRRVLASQTITSGAPGGGWVHVNLTQTSPSETNSFKLARQLDKLRLSGQDTTLPSGLGASPSTKPASEYNKVEGSDTTVPEGSEDVVLEVTCRHCNHRQWTEQGDLDKHQPFLTIHSTIPIFKNNRRRRSAQECSSSGASAPQGCCRESMYVSLSELGWNDWIIQPTGFTLYYCKGSCSEPTLQDVLRGGNTYDGLLMSILLRDTLSPSVRAAVAPCCSAQSSDPLSIVWLNAANAVSVDHLPNMVVTRCGCAG